MRHRSVVAVLGLAQLCACASLDGLIGGSQSDSGVPPDGSSSPDADATEVSDAGDVAVDRGGVSADGSCSCSSVFQTCVDGGCVCAAPTSACTGRCVDEAVDPLNCGSCGHACEPVEQCMNGQCTCPANADRCGRTCVPRGTQSNCSINGMQCQTCCGDCIMGQDVCRGDSCGPNMTPQCPGALTPCGATNQSACVDTQTDLVNCGSCGKQCAAAEFCVAGSCVPYEPAPFCTSCNACGAQCTELLGGQAFRCCTTTALGNMPVCVAGAACP